MGTRVGTGSRQVGSPMIMGSQRAGTHIGTRFWQVVLGNRNTVRRLQDKQFPLD